MCLSQAELAWIVAILSLAGLSLVAVSVLHTVSVARRKQDQLRDRFADELAMREGLKRFLASELHDNVGQLTALNMLRLDELASREEAVPAAALRELADLAARVYHDVRAVSHLMDGGNVMRTGLEQSIRDAVRLLERHTACTVGVSLPPGGIPPLDPTATIVLFRAVQEALTNIAKHAQATEVAIAVELRGNRLAIHIADNGVGVSGRRGDGIGLYNMRRQLRQLGGNIQLISAPGEGTTLHLSLPRVNQSEKNGYETHRKDHGGHPG